MSDDIITSFYNYFEMFPATTEEFKRAAYRLRYEVFCLEMQYWDTNDCPDGLEMDEYDELAEHYILRHRETGVVAATTRLILPDAENPEWVFPIEAHSMITYGNLLDGVPRSQIAEVSRFCVSQNYKRRFGEKHTLVGADLPEVPQQHTMGSVERRTLPYFILALIACLLRMSIRHGTTHWLAFMEPALTRALRIIGIYFIPIGPLIDYCGRRGPYLIKIADLLEGTKRKSMLAWNMMTNHGMFWDEGDYGEWADRR